MLVVPLVSLIRTFRLTLLITPANVKYPGLALTKEPAGIVIVKLPIWSVTGPAGGLIPLLVFPRVKLELIEKPGWFG